MLYTQKNSSLTEHDSFMDSGSITVKKNIFKICYDNIFSFVKST